MTNREVLNRMSDWQLANFLRQVSNGETEFTTCCGDCVGCEMSEGYCAMGIAEWLYTEAKDEK